MIGKVFQAVVLKKGSEIEKKYAELFDDENLNGLYDEFFSVMEDMSDPGMLDQYEDWLAVSPIDESVEDALDGDLLKKIMVLMDDEKLFFTTPSDLEENPDDYQSEDLKRHLNLWNKRSDLKLKKDQVAYLLEYWIEGPFYIDDYAEDFEEALADGKITEIITDEYNFTKFYNNQIDFIVEVRLKDGTIVTVQDETNSRHDFSCHKITSTSVETIEE